MWWWLPLVMATSLAAPVAPSDWRVVNDTVMGGRSSGALEMTGEGALQFTGRLSLENNGGFVSIRSVPERLNLGGVSALRIRVIGDGRTWSVNLYRRDVPLRAGSYRAMFDTKPEGVTEVVIPLADFEPTSFGRWVPGLPALDSAPEQVNQVGFLLGDKRPGPFSLTVLSVDDVRADAMRGTGHNEVMQTLSEAIRLGVPMFNEGDLAGCRDLYQQGLASVVEHGALTQGERRIVRAALADAANEDPGRAAWTLRHAMDSLLGGGMTR